MVWFFFICTFIMIFYWPHFPPFPFLLPISPVLSTPLLLIIFLILRNNLSHVLWTAFFKPQVQKPPICQPYLKVSSNDSGVQASLLLLILLICGLKLICPQHASVLDCTWVSSPGSFLVACDDLFFLQAEANSVSYDASCMFVSISLVN